MCILYINCLQNQGQKLNHTVWYLQGGVYCTAEAHMFEGSLPIWIFEIQDFSRLFDKLIQDVLMTCTFKCSKIS